MNKIKSYSLFFEAKMFDNYEELLEHGQNYLDKFHIENIMSWKKRLESIIQNTESFRYIGYTINSLIEDVKKDQLTLENFDKDINSHIKELDLIYQKSGTLSSKDDEAYEKLDILSDEFRVFLEFTEEYLEELESVSKSYISIDDKLGFLLKAKLKK